MGKSKFLLKIEGMFNDINLKLKEFSNLDFKIYAQRKVGKNAVDMGANIVFLGNNECLNKEILDTIMVVLKNQISIHFNEIEYLTDRMVNSFIEDICIQLLFGVDIKHIDEYKKAYSFIKQLEDIGNKTYETDPISMGLIVLNKYDDIKAQLSALNVDYVPIKDNLYIDEL